MTLRASPRTGSSHAGNVRRDHHRRRAQRPGHRRYLARAEWKVLVLERRHLVGGACVTEETFPGFKVSTAAYVNSLFRPEIIRDLHLKDYGFELLERNPSSFTPFLDGRYLMMGPDQADEPARDRQVQHEGRRELSRSTRRCSSASPTWSSRRCCMTPPNLLRPGPRRPVEAVPARPRVPEAGHRT